MSDPRPAEVRFGPGLSYSVQIDPPAGNTPLIPQQWAIYRDDQLIYTSDDGRIPADLLQDGDTIRPVGEPGDSSTEEGTA
jgi:hypothetical protein